MTEMTPWFRSYMNLDPAVYIKRLECPLLALFGARDQKLPPKAISMFKSAISKLNGATFEILPTANHHLQECSTGSEDEFAKITQTIAPQALNRISDWIRAL